MKPLIILSLLAFAGCASSGDNNTTEVTPPPGELLASVVSVSATGGASNYQFSVGIESPDKDCEQYANWWEVIRPNGTLVYRRILTHSHPNEQPFIRSGGPVQIGEHEEVIIRAHMVPTGYGGAVFRGSVSAGFTKETLSGDFAKALQETQPLPTVCTS